MCVLCCSPNTGKMLVYGKAMAHRTTHVELPSVSALFTDISSRVSQKSWLASATPPKVGNAQMLMTARCFKANAVLPASHQHSLLGIK